MRQAYAHIEKDTTHYQDIKDQVLKLVKNWNDTHNSKCDPQVIFDDFKRIFKYHKWISIDDIEPAIDLGLMGEFGENKGLNSETIFKWFAGLQRKKNQNELKDHTAYKSESTFISMDQRQRTRKALIEIFMKFWNEYKKTKVYNPAMDHYIPVFFRWFQNLKYIVIDEDKKRELAKYEAGRLRDLRTIFSRKPGQEDKTIKSTFIEHFILACESNYPIEEQLNKIKL